MLDVRDVDALHVSSAATILRLYLALGGGSGLLDGVMAASGGACGGCTVVFDAAISKGRFLPYGLEALFRLLWLLGGE